MSPNTAIRDNIDLVQQRIREACKKAGRDPDTVQLIPVTKTVEPERMLKAIKCGLSVVAENKVQEAQSKIEKLGERASEFSWHFVGHLQTNKVSKVIEFASMIQSVDRMRLVKKLDKQLAKAGRQMDILIQVNTTGELSKYGVNPDEVLEFVKAASTFEHLSIRGLMTIGLFSEDWPRVREGFRLLRELRNEISAHNIDNVEMKHLSMGMTNDFEIAIEEGATMVRVGRAIFGERKHSDSYYWPGIGGGKEKQK